MTDTETPAPASLVATHEASLTARWKALEERREVVELARDVAMSELRDIRHEQDGITRILAAYKRVRTPRRRIHTTTGEDQ
jgi:hypothetical protein